MYLSPKETEAGGKDNNYLSILSGFAYQRGCAFDVQPQFIVI